MEPEMEYATPRAARSIPFSARRTRGDSGMWRRLPCAGKYIIDAGTLTRPSTTSGTTAGGRRAVTTSDR